MGEAEFIYFLLQILHETWRLLIGTSLSLKIFLLMLRGRMISVILVQVLPHKDCGDENHCHVIDKLGSVVVEPLRKAPLFESLVFYDLAFVMSR